MKIFESSKIPLLSKALSAYSLRQRVTAANIANINTVGYRALAITFDDEMEATQQKQETSLAVSDKNHITGTGNEFNASDMHVVDAASAGIISNDSHASGVNNVDIDREMTELAQNQLRFKYAARLLTETFREIQKSIRGQA